MAATNGITVSPADLHAILKAAIVAREPVLITGSPGCGKTDIGKSVTSELGYRLVLTHPVVQDSTDYKGFPSKSEDGTHAVWLPYGDLHEIAQAAEPTVVFIDDLGQAVPTVQAAIMQLVLSRAINGHRISDHVTFIAATNRRSDRAGVNAILEPLKSRFTIVNVQADVGSWQAWAARSGISPMLPAFLSHRPELLDKFEPSAEMTNSPSPRGWAAVNRHLGLGLNDRLLLAMMSGSVGQGAAAEFTGFMRVFAEIGDMADFLADPDAAPIPLGKTDRMWAISSGLALTVEPAQYGAYLTYLNRVCEAGGSEYAVLSLTLINNRPDAKLTSDPSFAMQIAGKPLGRAYAQCL